SPTPRATVRPATSKITKIAMKMKKNNFAIARDAPAIDVKPRRPATRPISKKKNARRSMETFPKSLVRTLVAAGLFLFRVLSGCSSQCPADGLRNRFSASTIKRLYGRFDAVLRCLRLLFDHDVRHDVVTVAGNQPCGDRHNRGGRTVLLGVPRFER